MTTYPQKINFGEMRASGVRGVLIYCRDHRCSHHVEISADLAGLRTAVRHRAGLRLHRLRQARRGCQAGFSQAKMGTA
jgi:hypothetical protein